MPLRAFGNLGIGSVEQFQRQLQRPRPEVLVAIPCARDSAESFEGRKVQLSRLCEWWCIRRVEGLRPELEAK